jgi:hypothetical protein
MEKKKAQTRKEKQRNSRLLEKGGRWREYLTRSPLLATMAARWTKMLQRSWLPSLSRGLVPSRTATNAKTALLARTGFRVFGRLCGGVSRYHRVQVASAGYNSSRSCSCPVLSLHFFSPLLCPTYLPPPIPPPTSPVLPTTYLPPPTLNLPPLPTYHLWTPPPLIPSPELDLWSGSSSCGAIAVELWSWSRSSSAHQTHAPTIK